MRFFMHSISTPALVILVIMLGSIVFMKNQQIDDLQHSLALAKQTAEARKHMIEEARLLQEVVASPQVLNVTVTAYNPTEDQCDADPLVAASMRKVREGTIAVSRDLFNQGWVFGKKVRIEGLGIFEINDLMNKRFTKRVDVFMWDQDQATKFGKRVVKAALLEI